MSKIDDLPEVYNVFNYINNFFWFSFHSIGSSDVRTPTIRSAKRLLMPFTGPRLSGKHISSMHPTSSKRRSANWGPIPGIDSNKSFLISLDTLLLTAFTPCLDAEVFSFLMRRTMNCAASD